MQVNISLIVAVAENGVIGAAGTLPWRISSDLKTFRRLTKGKPVVMGRRTFQSLPKVLDGRDNIVVSRDPFFEAPEGVSLFDNLTDALTLARTLALTSGTREVMVIGGAELFRDTLPKATRLYWTDVHAAPEGDTYFPEFDLSEWTEVSREELPQGPKDDVRATLRILERKDTQA